MVQIKEVNGTTYTFRDGLTLKEMHDLGLYDLLNQVTMSNGTVDLSAIKMGDLLALFEQITIALSVEPKLNENSDGNTIAELAMEVGQDAFKDFQARLVLRAQAQSDS